MNSDLFMARVLVSIADVLRDGTDIAWVTSGDAMQRAKLALGPINDLSKSAHSAVIKHQFLTAFWLTFAREIPPGTGGNGLAINPPPYITNATFEVTSITSPKLGGHYGRAIKRIPTEKDLLGLELEHGLFFNEVHIFDTLGIDAGALADRILPGTVLSFWRPGAPHDFWVQFLGLNFQAFELTDWLSRRFKLTELGTQNTDNTSRRLVGIEAK